MSKGPQSFGGAGGGGARVTVLLTGSPFSTLAALEAYSAANPSELLNNTDQVSLAVVNSDGANNGTYEYSGVSGVYVTGQWVMFSGLDASDIKNLYESNPDTNAFTNTDTNAVASVAGLSENSIPVATASGLQDGPQSYDSANNMVESTAAIKLPGGGALQFDNNDLSSGGTVSGGAKGIRFTNLTDLTTDYLIGVPFSEAGSGTPSYDAFGAGIDAPSLSDKSDARDAAFDFINPLPGIVTEYTVSRPAGSAVLTDCNFIIWLDGYNTGVPLFDFKASNPGGAGFTLSPGDNTVTPPVPIGFPANIDPTSVDQIRLYSHVVDSSGALVQLEGQEVAFPPLPDPRSESVWIPYLDRHVHFSVNTELQNAVDHPVTLRRDMPSEEDAQALADASLDDNSALWIVSADQAASANRADATIQAERSGMLDLSGDEIPTTATTANTLQLRVGTVLKIMAANEYRVLSSPLYNTDVTDNSAVEIQQNGVQVVAAATVINFVGNGVTVTEVGGVATVTITGTVNPPQASHSNFIALTADNLAATVDTASAIVSDDLNPTVTLPTFTGNRYIQILQSQAHTAFTSIVLSGINQFGAFTVNENARTIDGQAYRQYVTTNLITDAVSGQTMTMSGAN